ncbi:uncharacterized protein LOC110312018 [Mus caroli]|uniref:Uncharacterized protein LOC110312018 n=1 Tax=Mus caroli TaxID=10089 RepID=A0A6P5RE92_MUSCR|nr:uncharacterized protein LOC110312018 [Mus caroli]
MASNMEKGETSHLGAAGSSLEKRPLPTKRGSTAAQRPHGEGGMAKKPRQGRTLPHAPARVGAPLPFRKCLRKASVFRFLEQPATHCSPAVPLRLSLRLCFPGWPLTNSLPALSVCGVASSALRCRH